MVIMKRMQRKEKLIVLYMKRRKVIGLVLVIVTFVYFIACLLAFYQNQRVKMEKGIEEALKAYSGQESLDIKELSNDFNLRLDGKLDAEEGKQQILKFEGSFERMEKNITNVTDEMALVETNILNLNERLNVIENSYNELFVELTSKYDLYEETFLEIEKKTLEMQTDIEEIKNIINEMEKKIEENNSEQEKNTDELQSKLEEINNKLTELIPNLLLYQYDDETQTLHVYGKKEEE